MKYLLLLVSFFYMNFAYSASFDCSQAKSSLEKIICSDDTLSKLDETLNSTYKEALTKSQDPADLKQQQRTWLSKVRTSCVEAGCITSYYKTRIGELKYIISDPIVNTTNSNQLLQEQNNQINQADKIEEKKADDTYQSNILPSVEKTRKNTQISGNNQNETSTQTSSIKQQNKSGEEYDTLLIVICIAILTGMALLIVLIKRKKGSKGEINQTEKIYWDSIKDSKNPDEFKAYVNQYPTGAFYSLAVIRIESLEKINVSAENSKEALTTGENIPFNTKINENKQPIYTYYHLRLGRTSNGGNDFIDCMDSGSSVIVMGSEDGYFILGSDGILHKCDYIADIASELADAIPVVADKQLTASLIVSGFEEDFDRIIDYNSELETSCFIASESDNIEEYPEAFFVIGSVSEIDAEIDIDSKQIIYQDESYEISDFLGVVDEERNWVVGVTNFESVSTSNNLTEPKRIYIKTEPGGRVGIGKLNEEETSLLLQAFSKKEVSDELLDLKAGGCLDLREYEGVFNAGNDGDDGNEGVIAFSSSGRIEIPDAGNGLLVDGAYLIYLTLSKVSIDFSFRPTDGSFDQRKLSEESVPINLPDFVHHDLYGNVSGNIVVDYLYDGEPIEEYDRELTDRGYDDLTIFVLIMDGKLKKMYRNYNGEESWQL